MVPDLRPSSTSPRTLPVVPPPTSIVVLHGDQTGEELMLQALRLLDPDLIGVEVGLRHFDLCLSQRRATRNQVVLEAAAALREAGFA
jgi:isocitrate dehydrogenase (NAD+)